MSNKKIKLPDGSFKRAKKGYNLKEIHVPAPKQKPDVDGGELVAVTALPPWAHEVFNVPKLNRVQSKVFPVTFGTDEPILLCAPTGSGKVCIYYILDIYLSLTVLFADKRS
jgi:pre-mRNA-splicing helicase BRR2